MFCAQPDAGGHTCEETEERVLFCCLQHIEDRGALFTNTPSGLCSAIAASDVPTHKLNLLLTSTHPSTWVALSMFLQAYVRKRQRLLDRVRCDLGQSVLRGGRIRMPRKRAFICPHGKLHYYAIRDICDCELPECLSS